MLPFYVFCCDHFDQVLRDFGESHVSSPQQFPEPTLGLANPPRESALPSSPSVRTGSPPRGLPQRLTRPHPFQWLPLHSHSAGKEAHVAAGLVEILFGATHEQTGRRLDRTASGLRHWDRVRLVLHRHRHRRIPDSRKALEVEALVRTQLGVTRLKRIGRAPRAVLVFRVAAGAIIHSRHVGKIDIIGDGAYFVGYGLHPGTGQPYAWPIDAPVTTKVADLPGVTQSQIDRFIERLADYYRIAEQVDDDQQKRHTAPARLSGIRSGWIYNNRGQVIDGRDRSLTAKTYQAFANGASTPKAIADQAWSHFVAGADLTRPKRDSNRRWQKTDAVAKAAYLLRSGKPRPPASIVAANSYANVMPWSSDDLERFIKPSMPPARP